MSSTPKTPKELSFLEQEAADAREAQEAYDKAQAEEAARKHGATLAPIALPAGTDPAVLALLQMQQETNNRLAAAFEKMNERSEAGPTPQIPFAQAKFKTPWNPTGEPLRRELARSTWINGHRVHESRLSQEEIDLLNLLKAGKYHDRKWVVVEADGDTGQGRMVSLLFPNKTFEQRLEINTIVGDKGLVKLLQLILDEAKAVVLAA